MELQFEDKPYLERLRALPNAQVHVHLDGAIPFEDLWDYYQANEKPLFLPERYINGNPVEGDREIKTKQQLIDFRDGLLTKYHLTDVFNVPVNAMQTPQELQNMSIAVCKYSASQNTFYLEPRFAPLYHSKEDPKRTSKLWLEEAIENVLIGLDEGSRKYGIDARNLTICINREVDPKGAEKIVRAALAFEGKGVVGIDLACYEPPFPPENFVNAFALTFGSSLKRTVHVDEMVSEEEGVKNLKTALFRLYADAISHAKHLYKHPQLIDSMLNSGVYLESNPISNLTCGFIKDVADLHLDELVEAGVKVNVNADDPAMWPNGDLAHNLYLLGRLYGDEFVEKVLRNGIGAASGLNELEKRKHNHLLTLNLKAHGFRQ